MEKEARLETVGGRMEKDGMGAVWMKAADDRGAWRAVDAEALGADGDGAVGGDARVGADTPDVGPPRAFGGGTQRGAFFAEREAPGGERSGAQFAVEFAGVAMLDE